MNLFTTTGVVAKICEPRTSSLGNVNQTVLVDIGDIPGERNVVPFSFRISRYPIPAGLRKGDSVTVTFRVSSYFTSHGVSFPSLHGGKIEIDMNARRHLA